MENQEGFENPWTVGSLEHFLYYCCPECHHLKFTSRNIFLQHAINQHPLAQKCLQKLTDGKEEEILKEDKGDITKESEKDHIDIEVLSIDDGETNFLPCKQIILYMLLCSRGDRFSTFFSNRKIPLRKSCLTMPLRKSENIFEIEQ